MATPPSPSGTQISLRHGDQEATVVGVGGGLRTLTVAGRSVLDGYGPDEMCTGTRGQPLVPWPNRIRDGRYRFAGHEEQLAITEPAKHNAIHGLALEAHWTAIERRQAAVAMALSLKPEPGYPFELNLRIDYTVGDRGLEVRLSATNVGSASCPYGHGFHPYLTLGTPVIDPLVLEAPGSRRLVTDEQAIPVRTEPVDGSPVDFRSRRPIGDTVLDTGYTDLSRDADGLTRVVLADSDTRRLSLWMDGGYPYVMLYTGDTLDDPHKRRTGLAVEPMTCAPDAFNSGDGLRILAPGETASAAWGIDTLDLPR